MVVSTTCLSQTVGQVLMRGLFVREPASHGHKDVVRVANVLHLRRAHSTLLILGTWRCVATGTSVCIIVGNPGVASYRGTGHVGPQKIRCFYFPFFKKKSIHFSSVRLRIQHIGQPGADALLHCVMGHLGGWDTSIAVIFSDQCVSHASNASQTQNHKL